MQRTPSGIRERVLVIDDQEDIREVVRMSLEVMRDVHVVTAASGEEGVRLARGVRPCAILLDWAMPQMDGPATLRALQDDDVTRAIPVVALTARASEVRAEDGLCGVLAKPFDPERLPADVEQVLGCTLGSP